MNLNHKFHQLHSFFLTKTNVIYLWHIVTMKNTALSCRCVFVHINDFAEIVVL